MSWVCHNDLRFHNVYAYVLGHDIASSLRYKYIGLKRDKSASPKHFSETDITMVEFSFVVMFGWSIYQQTVGIHMGTDCSPSYSYEADYIDQ